MFKKFNYCAIALLTVLSFACKKDEHDHDDHEVTTTVVLRLTNNANAADRVVAVWKDLDGTGGKLPDTTMAMLALKPNATYTGKIFFVNEQETPADTLNKSMALDEHLVVYKPSTGLNTTFVRTDKDKNNLEVGFNYNMSTGAASIGRLRVVLRHQPGVKNGSESPGTTDIDVGFKTTIGPVL